LAGKTALWKIGGALHIEKDVMRSELIFDSGFYVHFVTCVLGDSDLFLGRCQGNQEYED